MSQGDHAEAVLAVSALRIAFARQAGPADLAPPAVDLVSFEVERGRVLALVGESGSGKSATAMSILGLLPGSAEVSGSVRLEGRELIGADAAHLRRVRGGRIGTIFQEPMSAFTPAYRIGWQIAEAIRAHDPRRPRGQVRARTLELLASVGLRDPERVARAYPHELSGGQLQRAMIAMAISCDPVVLIADEPTTALDVTVQAGILELLRGLRATRGTAILLITHDMGVVADLADDVVVMRRGTVVETGPVQQIFSAPAHEYTRELLAAVPTLATLQTSQRDAEEEAAPLDETLAAEVRDAVIAYGRRGRGGGVVAVSGASFRIPRGRTFGLVGESGSGKSTLGRAFAGLLPLRSGSIEVAGIDLAAASASRMRALRRSLGYVFQDPASSINPRTLVGDAVTEPLRLHTSASSVERRARAAELLDAVHLPRTTIDRFPHELSGGQRQRVAIARAIALNPTLLIADEPTSALDVSVQARVLELLAELQSELGFACLFISHDLAVVQALADEVGVMRRGEVVEIGPADRVLTSPEHPYTRRLLAAAPVADPVAQSARRELWLALDGEDPEVAA
ncbi:ABC transporter ATP-binding protein [Homoserinibacter sp. GY 40078]|uniref:dipeptide ABC transporter ATP-binding protein n=1 Tax=Homoserinibacter sp. GY 40078 TaxID=2603275 RepID=UPI0011CA4167|nr:ABC transporter ATP-binding protein [Homoserinibacter sp. GY 40078]TXK18864.1 ABC transporter ATP-binding protein [Homoserinibacter sp. GY 40078]